MVAEREYAPLPSSDDTLLAARGERYAPAQGRRAASRPVHSARPARHPAARVPPQRRHSNTEVEAVDPVIEAYWTGVATQGYAAAVKDKHGDHDHKHKHPHHPDHKHPHKWSRRTAPRRSTSTCRATARRPPRRAGTLPTRTRRHGWDLITALQVKNDWEAALGLRQSGADEHIYEAGSHESQSRIRGEGALKKLGVWIDTYYPVLNTPVSSSVTLLTDPPVHAKLREEYSPATPTRGCATRFPFHGFSVSGNVQAQYIYEGGTEEFELLQSKGIDFKGKIAARQRPRIPWPEGQGGAGGRRDRNPHLHRPRR
jgi:N-acetylated-alpha-linked acidic dipeptidase